jgi:hypothetical protein
VKYARIDAHRGQFSVSRLCRVLAVSRSGYCQWRTHPPRRRAQANAALDTEVAAIHRANRGSHGRPRIVRQLRTQGQPVGAERVRRSLQRQGLRPVYKRPCRVTTDSAHNLPVAPNLLDRRFDGWRPNQAWVSDITFVATDEGWLFLAAILDLPLCGHSRGSLALRDHTVLHARSHCDIARIHSFPVLSAARYGQRRIHPKGRRGRYAMLSPVLLERLRAWWRVAHAQGKMLEGAGCFRASTPSSHSAPGSSIVPSTPPRRPQRSKSAYPCIGIALRHTCLSRKSISA